MLNICISFDYELYMGKNDCSLNEILIDPTNEILEMLDKYNVKATFFADVCCPVFFEKNMMEKDFTHSMREQLRDMQRRKQDVQLHIHPHWLKTEYNEAERSLSFDKKYYRIHSYGFDNGSNSVQDIIKKSVAYLEDVLLPIDNGYKCIAYRAGGFAVQPEEELTKVLLENGIRIDSSVAEKCEYPGTNMRYDFSFCDSKHNFFFNAEKGFRKRYREKEEDRLLEVPIATCSIPLIKYLIVKKNPSGFAHYSRGSYMNISDEKQKKQNALSRRINALFKDATILSLDHLCGDALYDLAELYKKTSKAKNNDVYISVLGHPKLFNHDKIKSMETFIKKVQTNKDMRFVTMREIYDEVFECKG